MKARVDLVLDCADPEALAAFWRETLDYRDYYVAADVAILVPKEGVSPPLVLQRVPEPKSAKNRMHLDVVVDEIEPEVARCRHSARNASTTASRTSVRSAGYAWQIPSTTSSASAPAWSGSSNS